MVVFWDEVLQGAMAHHTRFEGQERTFRVEGGAFVGDRTGSEWDFEGDAISGPATGAALEPAAETYVAFWFAWADFHPATVLWQPAS